VVADQHGHEREAVVPEGPVGDGRSRRWPLLLLVVAVAAITGAGAGSLAGVLTDDAGSPTSASCPAPADPSAAPAAASGLPAIIAAVRPSVISIDVTSTRWDDNGSPVFGTMAGTGVVIDADGLVATNSHVVEGGGRVVATLPSGESVEAAVLGTDEALDLAVIDVGVGGLVPARFGCSAELKVGQTVVALGNALALGGEPSASTGIVAAVDREISTPSGRTYTRLIQIDVATNEGQSGGPVFDDTGQVVGITTAGLAGGSGVGFAIGIDDVLPVLDELRGGADV
jgi:S1-C subfamily serine protease